MLLLTQSNTGSQASDTQQADSKCDAQVEAYLSRRDSCLDFYEQLNFLKLRIADARKQRDELLQQCKHAKDPAACQRLADLSAGRMSILEQEYTTLALRGCQATTPNLGPIAKTCAAGANAYAKKAASNQDPVTPASQKQGQVKAVKDLQQSPSASHQQSVSQEKSVSNSQAHAQPTYSLQTAGTSGGTGSSRQSDFGGAARGSVNASASSAGAGRQK